MRTRDLVALCVDYDRTLTDPDLRLVPEAVQALVDARRAGKRVVIVSGRDLPFLEERLGHACDAIVAENGCLVRGPDGEVVAAADKWDVQAALDALGVPIEYGRLLASLDVGETARAQDALARAGIEADLIPNRDRVMVLPRGVDKAAGLRRALDLLGVDPARAAAAGDGENDVPMLLAVGHGVAVANAVDALKEVAAEVTARPGGHGVADWVRAAWLRSEVRA